LLTDSSARFEDVLKSLNMGKEMESKGERRYREGDRKMPKEEEEGGGKIYLMLEGDRAAML
jgi:hypothetical protein